MFISNPVTISIIVLLALSMMRINVVIGLIISALAAGVTSELSILQTVETFTGGLGRGAETAMNYAVLGAFAVAISKSGVTDLLAYKGIKYLGYAPTGRSVVGFKYFLFVILVLISIASQNLIPVHIAFIPIVVPPLLVIFNQLKLDRRAIACILTFGLIAGYMVIPISFGRVFMESILVRNINLVGESLGLHTDITDVFWAMIFPVVGMAIGMLLAVFVTYRKPREYVTTNTFNTEEMEQYVSQIKPFYIYVSLAAIIVTFALQLFISSIIIGGLAGLTILGVCGVFKLKESNDIFQRGLHLMAMMGFVMIAAQGYAAVINATGGVQEMVNSISEGLGPNSKGLAAFLMLLVGLLITMGIGSSFSTVPIITSIYVPLCVSLGFSPLATVSIVGVAAALGDAGSPASDSTLGPTSGLNADGKHDHIWDTVIPTFIHYNIPLLVFGWVAAMYL